MAITNTLKKELYATKTVDEEVVWEWSVPFWKILLAGVVVEAALVAGMIL